VAKLTHAPAGEESLPLLAEFNRQLLKDQGLRREVTVAELENRLRELIAGDFQAVLFYWKNDPVGYCLYRLHPRYAHIRHIHLQPDIRRHVDLSEAFSLLRREELQDFAMIRIDVPEADRDSITLWESQGFRPRSLRLELHTATRPGRRKSCGAIIYRRRLGRPVFLVVRHRSGDHWGFAKGHVDSGETEVETALREVHEETGLRIRFRDGFYERIYYLTPKERRKEVVYFLGRAPRKRVRIQHAEISEHRWLPYWKTREILTYENTRLLLDKAVGYLQERGL
jgi:8-oxo-dGTP pyrophosphatase MutT (NUDIX family)